MNRFNNILKQRLEAAQSAQAAHPSADTLVAFVEQGLTGTQRQVVLGHLSVCPECRQAAALATPEAATAKAAAIQALRPALHFPSAMRWASLAAGLAVAVGVGVIAYEHEAAPIQHQAMVSAPPEKANQPAASPAPPANAEAAQSNLQSPATRSSQVPQSHPLLAARRDADRTRNLAKKEMPANAGILGGLPGRAPQTERDSKDSLKTLPSAPQPQSGNETQARYEGQPMVAEQRAAVHGAPPLSAPSLAQSVSVTAENKQAEDLDNHVAFAKSGSASGGVVGGVAGTTNFVQNPPVPAKTLNTVSVSGPSAKGKAAYAWRGFVHWTISAAGKLQRRAVDGTLTIVEPVPGAIIRAVAAEGIEVWAGGSRFAPTPKNVQPRSVLFHSSDAGTTWNTIDGPWQGSITRVNLAGFNSLTVVATDGTWNTGDGGNSWSKP